MKTQSSDFPCPSCSALRAEVDALKQLLAKMRQQMDALQMELNQTRVELARTGSALSTGMLAKVVKKVSTALATPYQELWKALRQQETLNIDETGHPENGQSLWNWVFRAPGFTLFTIEASRSAQVLEDVLGTECEAVLDSADTFRRRLERQRDQFLRQARRTQAGAEAAVLAKRFRTHGREYFTFITQPDIDPTNNVAERAIRFCVIDRLITQGTRGRAGRQWCERIWTTLATCAQKGHRAFHFIREAVQANFSGTQPPSLLALD